MSNFVGAIREKRGPDIREQLSAAIVSSSSDAIIAETLDGTITSWNTAAEHIYGYGADEAVGLDVSILVPPGTNDLEEALARVARGEPVDHYESMHVRKDGTAFPVSLTVSPVRERSDTITGAAIIARDVTESRRLEDALAEAHAELERKNADLERSNADLEQFAYVASHDLSEPLRVIAGYVGLLARRYQDRLDDEANEFIDFAVDGCARLQRLIDDLLAYSRVARAVPAPTSVDCAPLLAQVRSSLAVQLADSQATVDVGPLPTLTADARGLAILFQNLISNAVKFARPGVAPRVEVRADRDGAGWRFSVTDNGIGVDPKYQERIFRMFQRLHPRDEYSGTGIGLAIAQRIVDSHGGRIWVENPGHDGSRFCFTIPDAEEIPA
ncbi:MAG TPA: ATP-binding protein [Acidimicrobiales bacterium]|nr:ATP-binding protein [Acidimicrobiales bacterium]